VPTSIRDIEPQSMFAIRGHGVKAVRGWLIAPLQRAPPGAWQWSRPLTSPAVFKKDKVAGASREEPAIERVENAAAKPPRKTSLRRVGLEAEQSRVVIKNKGRVRVIEGGTKVGCTFELS
jgi:hypothetical protein